MFRFFKLVFVMPLSVDGSLATQSVKSIFLNNKPCLVIPKFLDLCPRKLCYYLFVVEVFNLYDQSEFNRN